jgi:hypothetical protein
MNKETPNRHTNSADNPRSWGEAGDLARGDPEAKNEYNGRESALGGGDSGGGAYPNPHTGKKADQGGFMGHGGQTEMTYHGTDQLGEQSISGGDNVNAAARKTKPGEKSDR